MKHLAFTSLLVIILALCLKAGPVTKERASVTAKNHYWKYSSELQYEEILPQLVYIEELDGESLYYVFNIGDEKGFVIVAADDDVYPILGYSFEGSFIVERKNTAVNFSDWMDIYTDQILFVRENSLKADKNIAEEWQRLSAFSEPNRDFDNIIPMMTTKWDQGEFFNALCPADPGGVAGHVWTGCNATAMAQIMKYYNHPAQGQGSHSYTHSTYGTLSANFEATTYHWSNMPDQVTSSNMDIATLLYHCGVSVDMQYSINGSGAYSEDSRNAFIAYFRYSPTVQYVHKSNYSQSAWENLIKGELNEGRILYYDGSGPDGGHAFVCDGYQGTNYFHFNWGWGGAYDGYFYLNSINPGGTQFNNDQDAMVNLYPKGTYLKPPLNFQGNAVEDHVELSWQSPGGTGIKGYFVYRNEVKVAYVGSSSYEDMVPGPGNYRYCVSVVYNDGESHKVCAPEVIVEGFQSSCDFFDDFESYATGQQLVVQNPDNWKTWNNSSGTGYDPFITDYGTQVVQITGTNGLVHVIPNLTEGTCTIGFDIYIPSGSDACFNALQQFEGNGVVWGLNAYFGFENAGKGRLVCGEANPKSFDFNYSQWMAVKIVIDLDNDWAELFIDDALIHGWTWSTSANGSTVLNQLGGCNFYAWPDGVYGNPMYFIDNYCFSGSFLPPLNLSGPGNVSNGETIHLTWQSPESFAGSPNAQNHSKSITGYNIYRKTNIGSFVKVITTPYEEYYDSYYGGPVLTYYITAIYGGTQESGPSNTWLVETDQLGMEENSLIDIQLFPNPASESIHIMCDLNILSVTIYDFTGHPVARESVNNTTYRYNSSHLSAGIYFVVVETEKGKTSRRVIIE